MAVPRVELLAVPDIPLIQTGDDLLAIIQQALKTHNLPLLDGDVLVITSKIVSKAEGRWVDLAEVVPGEEAQKIARQCAKDPRLVAVILSESARISRIREHVLITEHRLGFTSANAGVDHSNTRPDGEWRLLLPKDPDATARQYRKQLGAAFKARIAVIITDSHGRPFRLGTVGVAIGAAGLPALWDWRGKSDLFGMTLQATEIAFADEIAAAAGLLSGQADQSLPVVIVRGLNYLCDEQARASDLVRPREMDLYR